MHDGEEALRRFESLSQSLIRRVATGDLTYEEMRPGMRVAMSGAAKAGITLSALESACLWQAFSSDEYRAGWLDVAKGFEEKYVEEVRAFVETLIREEKDAPLGW